VVGDALPGAIAELRVLARVAAGDARERLDQRLLVIRGLSKAQQVGQQPGLSGVTRRRQAFEGGAVQAACDQRAHRGETVFAGAPGHRPLGQLGRRLVVVRRMLGADARVKACRPVRRSTPGRNRLADSSETRRPDGGRPRQARRRRQRR
jgi:hypothetical protein